MVISGGGCSGLQLVGVGVQLVAVAVVIEGRGLVLASCNQVACGLLAFMVERTFCRWVPGVEG